jgi:hypothetical protein
MFREEDLEQKFFEQKEVGNEIDKLNLKEKRKNSNQKI